MSAPNPLANLAVFRETVQKSSSAAPLKDLLGQIELGAKNAPSSAHLTQLADMKVLVGLQAQNLLANAPASRGEVEALKILVHETLQIAPEKMVIYSVSVQNQAAVQAANKPEGSKYPTFEEMGFGKSHYDKEDPRDSRNTIKDYVPYYPPVHGVSDSG